MKDCAASYLLITCSAPRYYRPTEVDLLLGDATKARHQLGWQPRVDFKQLVRIMIDHDLELAKQEQERTQQHGQALSVSRWGVT